MKVCQICGDEGYKDLLIYCDKCHDVLVHRYCIDGPPNIDDDEVIWSCEDCVPRMPKPTSASRKSERINSRIDRGALCRKVRRTCRIDSGPSAVKRVICVGLRANNLADDVSNLDKKENGSIIGKQGKLKEIGTVSKTGGSAPDPVIRQNKKVLNSDVDRDEKNSEPSSGLSAANRLICMGLRANKLADDVPNLDEKENGEIKRKPGKLKEIGTALKKGGSEPGPLIRQNKKVLNSDDDREEKCSEPSSGPSASNRLTCAGLRANKLADDVSNLDEKGNGDIKRKQGKLKEIGTALKKGGFEPAPLIRQNKKVLNSDDVRDEKSLEPSLLTGKKTKYVDGEDIQTKLETSSDQSLERTFKADDRSGEDSGADKLHKYEKSVSGIHSSLVVQQQEIRSSQAVKQPDGVQSKSFDSIEEVKAVSASHQRDDKQPHFNIYEFQTSRKRRRRLVIAMECSDSDEESVYVKPEPPVKIGNLGLAQQSFTKSDHHVPSQPSSIKSDDYFPTQPSPMKSDDHFLTRPSPIKSDDHFPARPSLIKSDNHMSTPTSSMDFDNGLIPQRSPVLFNHHVPAQPIISALWRGECSITDDALRMSFGLEAHLSNKAHARVHGAASALPHVLSFDIVQKHYAWPKSFEKSPPTSDTIGLYFFPVGERDEKWYDYLLEKMIEGDFMMISRINNLELLVFCSLQLPREERRYQSKYYLWGVFKPRQETSLTSQAPGIHISDTINNRMDLGVTGTIRNPANPPSVIDNHSVTVTSDSHDHLKAGDGLVELRPSIILKHPKPAYNKQGYSSSMESSDIDGLVRRDDHQFPTKFHNLQSHPHRIEASKYSYNKKGSNLHENRRKIRDGKPMKIVKDVPYGELSCSSSS
ncbi:hypothetical protein BVRB_6g133030 [Beta vulgaris subsp. vulgaris]|nr:hypothetical protein BVRB_6g133030 [Beta vulgaris subsp. vulgaris]